MACSFHCCLASSLQVQPHSINMVVDCDATTAAASLHHCQGCCCGLIVNDRVMMLPHLTSHPYLGTDATGQSTLA
jgi:hypothetical protein